MASADFSPLPHVDGEISPGKSIILLSNPDASTCSRLLVVGFAVMWLLTPLNVPHMHFLFVGSDICSFASFTAYLTINQLATY